MTRPTCRRWASRSCERLNAPRAAILLSSGGPERCDSTTGQQLNGTPYGYACTAGVRLSAYGLLVLISG